MVKLKKIKYLFLLMLLVPIVSLAQLKYTVQKSGKTIEVTSKNKTYRFSGDFVVIFSKNDPNLAMRAAGIKYTSYNVPTWKTHAGKSSDLNKTKVSDATGGDGLDDRILKGAQEGRTAGIVNAGANFSLQPVYMAIEKDTLKFQYKKNDLFYFEASAVLNDDDYPRINFVFKPKTAGYFSVGYTGAPEFDLKALEELWQPLIWQEKRFPDYPYVTTAHMSTLPATLSNDGTNSIGVMAAPEYLPFSPLPLLENSQFGISLRNENGKAKSRVFAPLMGGYKSKMEANTTFRFGFYLVVEPQTITYTYESIARKYFGFKDFRKNDISNLNNVIDNMIDYVQTKYAWYVDSLKGFSYATDVPGAVKNVSSLNPLDLAIVTDNEKIFKSRGYPLMQFMLSREKFLFSLDSTQKIQSPSRKMNGKVASLSELVALYDMFKHNNPFLLNMAMQKAGMTLKNTEISNFKGTWVDAMYLFKATGEKPYLQKAREGANTYIKERVEKRQEQFVAGNFFWTRFTNQWVDLLQLYEVTGDKEYLHAAHDGARHYTMFTYMTPLVPDSMITVNKGGKAPYYWYLRSKGYKQMSYPEEQAPAWRLSEIGLTPESSGTSSGHRAIFMANYAPWMLKLGYYTHDNYLKEVAKAAIIGRYRNFPGYHINTARTTAYEKTDYPLHNHDELSVNSFHYNHIMPMATMLIDYLVTDAFVRSDGKINFPSEFVEAYAYLQNNIYGAGEGNFYGEENVRLWMPARLLEIDNVELNYLSARNNGQLFIAFTNQSDKEVTTSIKINPDWVSFSSDSKIEGLDFGGGACQLKSNTFSITVPANGIASVKINHAKIKSSFQDKVLATIKSSVKDYAEIKEGNAKAMLIRLGSYANSLFVYLQDDDNKWKQAELQYTDKDEVAKSIIKKEYPFEFTVDVPIDSGIQFSLKLIAKDGSVIKSGNVKLGK